MHVPFTRFVFAANEKCKWHNAAQHILKSFIVYGSSGKQKGYECYKEVAELLKSIKINLKNEFFLFFYFLR